MHHLWALVTLIKVPLHLMVVQGILPLTTVSTTIDGTLDTSIIGSTATYTYTAYPDAAGNPGASATRIVTVVDRVPINVTSLTVSSNNPENSGYVKAGDNITITLVTDGSDITDITGTILGDASFTKQNSSGTATLSKIITQSDANGDFTFNITVTNSSEYSSSVTQNHLTSSNIISSNSTSINGACTCNIFYAV